jgi:riboflavin biosynthesis pyrimidine reductase
MRELLGTGATLDSVDLHAHYGTGWLDRGGIRANMIVSVDGAIAVAGRSGGLQTPGDTHVFTALRDLADVVLVGWATAAAENYGPARPSEDVRSRYGLAADLPVAVVSRSLRLDETARLFTDNRPLVITSAGPDNPRWAELARHADLLTCRAPDAGIDFGAARAALAERGLTRVLCEGGPRILTELLRAAQLDELCLTLSPLAVGPDPADGRLLAGDPWSAGPQGLRLQGVLEEDGTLFLRYSVARSASR